MPLTIGGFSGRDIGVFFFGVSPIYEVYSKAIDEVAGLCYVGLVLRPVLVSELTSTGCIS